MKTAFLFLFAALTASGQTRYFINTFAGTNPIGDNGQATQALLWVPVDVAVDAQRNLYITDTFNNRIRKVTPAGIITTIACTGVTGYGGDGGPATQAQCSNPNGVAVDPAGNVYFSDTSNNLVRKIGLDGKISRVAGDGYSDFSGDGGPATSAALNAPCGLALDPGGNLYISDNVNNRIRRITPDGNISTVAGTGTCSFSGDGGAATQATLCRPLGLTVDPQGRVLFADTANNRIRRFAPGGTITTVAGATAGFGGDNGPATAASLSAPSVVTADNKGNIYIADSYNHRIRLVAPNGLISTIAGSSEGFSGDGGAATGAWLDTPKGMAVDNQGNLYFADSGNNRIRTISPSNVISTIAGYGHYLGDNGPAVSAVMGEPSFVTADSLGNFYVSDLDNHVVRRIDATGKITTVAGTGIPGSAGDGGPVTSAQLNSPEGLATDSAGNIYVVDSMNASVRKFTPGGSIVKLAGGGAALGDGAPALNARLNSPHGIAMDSKGDIYIADTNNNRIRKITPDGVINTFIGDGTANSLGDGGLTSGAEVNAPMDIKVGSDGTVYFSESNGGRVRAVSPGGLVSTLGNLIDYANGLAIDSSGNIIVAGSNRLFSLTPSGVSTPLAGNATAYDYRYGFGGDGGPALNALLYYPVGVVTDSKGNIYFCDQENNRIRKLSPDVVAQVVSVSGDQQSAPAGSTLPLPLVVQVNGATGIAFPGVTVNYAVASGGGRLSLNQTVTGSDGRAGVTLILPNTAGTVTVTATVTGFPPVTFTATALDAPGSIAILGGNNQVGVAGAMLQQILDVVVYGVDQKPIAGVPVAFAVTAGSATLNPASMTTAFDGSAYTQVTLGSTAGVITVTATVTGLTPVTFSMTATPVNGPQVFAGGVVSAGLSTPPLQTTAPNAIVSIFGKNFAPAGTMRPVSGADLVNGMVPTNLAGVCVQFGTLRAPIFLITPGQLNVQAPQVQAPGTQAVQVITNCDTANPAASTSVNVAVQTAAPEFFYAANNVDGRNPVAATDGVSGAGIGDPARLGAGFALAYPGETVTIYATGLGLTTPAFAAGQLPPGGAQVSNLSVSIDGSPLSASAIQYAGVAPMNAGLYQLNIILPAFLTNGDHTITMTLAGQTSPAGSYISVGTK